MSSTIVQVKSDVHDPNFPSVSLENQFLEYVQSFDSNRVLFKFVNNTPEHIKRCTENNLNPDVICLDRSDVLWHKKHWNVSSNSEPKLSCYTTVKRVRK